MMQRLKPLSEQVMVITGASSGIGLATARAACKAGARVVLAARSEEALAKLEAELNEKGVVALAVPTDVGDPAAVQMLARRAMDRFGRIDTWVNDAGVSIYGKIEEVTQADVRRLFETNYFGVVNGSVEAAKIMKEKGGAIINLGSTVSDRAVPIQGHYSASKHAVKGFTDALRMELEADRSPVSVTLIKPAAINTPYTKHAKNYMPEEPSLPPPVYDPQIVADAILYAATHRVRDMFVGSGGKAVSAAGHWAPRLTDRIMEGPIISMQKKRGTRAEDPEGALHNPGGGLEERGNYGGHVNRISVYTASRKHPYVSMAVAGLVAIAAGVMLAETLSPSASQKLAKAARKQLPSLW